MAPSWLASREGVERRGAIRSFAEDFSSSKYYPVHRACRLVHVLTSHGVDRRISASENWIQWSLGLFYPPLMRSQRADCILEHGVGDCSERVAVLQELIREARLPTRIVGLDGHVVLEVHANGKWYTADPDYGVTFPVSVNELAQSSEEYLNDFLVRGGFDARTIQEYQRIVRSEEDNQAMPINAPLSPRLFLIEQLCDVGIIVLPCTFWALYGLLWLARSEE